MCGGIPGPDFVSVSATVTDPFALRSGGADGIAAVGGARAVTGGIDAGIGTDTEGDAMPATVQVIVRAVAALPGRICTGISGTSHG